MEYNLVEVWLRRDPARWIAGVLGGIFACAVAMGLAGLIAQSTGHEFLFPVKLMGTIVLGSAATEVGSNMDSVIAGGAVVGAICVFFGVVFAHFTGTNSLAALLPMGVVWGIFSWIFLWNLFLQSYTTIFAARIPSGPIFPICIAYGLALSSIAFFDPLLRGKSKA